MIIDGVCQECGSEDEWEIYCDNCGEYYSTWTPYEIALGLDN